MKKSATIVPPHGRGRLLAGGQYGNPGGGRPPDQFKARMRELANLPDKRGHIERVLGDPEHPQWMAALKHSTEHGYGKPVQSLDVAAKVEVVIRFEDSEP